jgi:hypothetical protein
MNLTKQELALVTYVRSLCFEAILDATEGIEKSEEAAIAMALKLEKNESFGRVTAFKKRAAEMRQLAELLQDANADYRRHMPAELAGDRVIKMIESDAGEVFHLFQVMRKYGAACSMEMKSTHSADPLIGMTGMAVNVEYLDGNTDNGDSVIIYLGDTELSVDLKNHSFTKYISNCQIDICISSDNYSFWFNSEVIPPEGIQEAKTDPYSHLYKGCE